MESCYSWSYFKGESENLLQLAQEILLIMILFIMSVTISLYLQSTNAVTITIFGLSTVNMGKLSMYLLPDLCNYFG